MATWQFWTLFALLFGMGYDFNRRADKLNEMLQQILFRLTETGSIATEHLEAIRGKLPEDTGDTD